MSELTFEEKEEAEENGKHFMELIGTSLSEMMRDKLSQLKEMQKEPEKVDMETYIKQKLDDLGISKEEFEEIKGK